MDENKINEIVNRIQEKTKRNALVESDIIEFFTLFETDDLIDLTQSDDWWCGGMTTLKSEDMKVKFFMPFMEYVLGKNPHFRDAFFKECYKRIINKDESFAEVKIFEIFLYEVSLEKLKSLCRDLEEQYFRLFYQLNDKNINQRHYSSDFWPFGFVENIGRIFSPIVRKKVSDLIINEDFNKILYFSRERYFQCLTLFDFISLILDPKLDFINFIITQTVKREDKYELYEHGFDFPDNSEKISQFISKKLVKILNESNDQKIDALIGLCLHIFIHFRDFIVLSQEVKKLFFVTAHKNNGCYHGRERQNLDWQLGQIKQLESGCILPYIIEIIKEGEIRKLENLFRKGLVPLLNRDDFLNLWNGSQHSIYDVILKINKDVDDYDYGVRFPPERLKVVKNHGRERIMKTVKEGDEQLIKVLFRLDFMDCLHDYDKSALLDDHDFIELMYRLRRGTYPDSYVGKKIYQFFKTNEYFLKSKLKLIIIDKLKKGNLAEVFNIWDYGWISVISDDQLCEILEQKDLHFFEKLLKAVHYHGYEKDYEHTCALFPLLRSFIRMPSRVRNALKPHVIEVIRSGNMNAIIPLIGSHYLEILDVDEITALIEDSKVRLLDILTKVSKDYDSELYYYNESFFNWIDRFNNFLLKFDYDLELIPRYDSLLEFISPHRNNAKFGMDSVNGTKKYEYVEIADEYFYVKDGKLDLRNFFIQDLSKIEGLFSLKTLKHLDIGYNWITELPDEIEKLQSLETLSIHESRLQKLPEAIGRLKNLKILDVQGNYLETLPLSLLDSDLLETVYLSAYKYHDLPLLKFVIDKLRNKGIMVSIHDIHWLE